MLAHEPWAAKASCLAVPAALAVSRILRVPVVLQMLCYTLPVLYLGSHLSLQHRIVKSQSDATGESASFFRPESLSTKDAALFPFIASGALITLFLAMKYLSPKYVNMAIALYIVSTAGFGVGETGLVVCDVLEIEWGKDHLLMRLKWKWPRPVHAMLGVSEQLNVVLTLQRAICFTLGVVVALAWFGTRNWMLNNVIAVCYSIQALRLLSVNSFSVASLLLAGLFIYDVFWVFGTNVMVSVASSFDAPAKLLFPVSFSPWRTGLLGLGDIVIPGLFIAMTLRLDHFLFEKHLACEEPQQPSNVEPDQFSTGKKFYFWSGMLCYASSLGTTSLVMLFFNRPQPALLYMVPACFIGLLVPALFRGHLLEIYRYSEEDEEIAATSSEKNSEEGRSDVELSDREQEEDEEEKKGDHDDSTLVSAVNDITHHGSEEKCDTGETSLRRRLIAS